MTWTTSLPLLLTTTEAAEQLAVSERQMRNLIATGAVRSLKLGHSRRVEPEALREYIERNRTPVD